MRRFQDGRHETAYERRFAIDEGIAHSLRMILALIFVLGIGNFAMHKAVLESGHSFLRQLPGGMSKRGSQVTLALEFAILLASMLFAANGWPNAAYAYVVYTALNAVSAWMILTGKM